jgi:DNA mismatch repair ATPase MutL
MQDAKPTHNLSPAKPPRPATESCAEVTGQSHEKKVQPTSPAKTSSVQSNSHSLTAEELAETSKSRKQDLLASTPDGSDHGSMTEGSQAEISLEKQIGQLCGARNMYSSTIGRNRQKLAVVKVQLAEQLYNYKQLLARTGRGGKWTSFLRSLDINRASADRWVQAHERSLLPQPEKRLTEALSGPSHVEIVALAKKLRPGLARVLTTSEPIAQFLT